MSDNTFSDRSTDSNQPTARINTTPDGDVLGVALFIGESQLQELGIDSTGHVGYVIEDGNLRLREVSDG